MKKATLVLMFLSLEVFGHSLECQLLREEILSESRQRQAQNSEQAAYAKGYAAGQNPLAGIMGQINERSNRVSQGLNQVLGQAMSLEQKIEVYKQACEK